MREQVWQLNSLLLVLLVLVTILNAFLHQGAPTSSLISATQKITPVAPLKMYALAQEKLEYIYKNDLLGTFIKPVEQTTSLIQPIPEPLPRQAPPMPQVIVPPLLPQLAITLKGIMFSSTPEQSVALISDETQKETGYFVGDSIRDGTILKIARSRVVILRSNGQQETFYLKPDDNLLALKPEELWEATIKKDGPNKYTVDPQRFATKFSSLGELLEDFMVATAYKKGKSNGIEVGDIGTRSAANALGFKKGDLILSINKTDLVGPANRYKVYEEICNLPLGATITVKITRGQEEVELSFVLGNIEQELKPPFFTPPQALTGEKAGLFKLSPLQQHDHEDRLFNDEHVISREDMIEQMRQRILKTLEANELNRRER